MYVSFIYAFQNGCISLDETVYGNTGRPKEGLR